MKAEEEVVKEEVAPVVEAEKEAEKEVEAPVVEEKVEEAQDPEEVAEAQEVAEPEEKVEEKVEAVPEPVLPAEDRGKYMLLDRLFRFLDTKEHLNEVLAGYFEKLVISLRKRKEHQFIKYIFGEKNENLDMLVEHVYNTSIAEVLRNMLTVTASNYDPDFQQVIKDKKTHLLHMIIERLTAAYPLHHNMGASSIIIDLMDEKEATELFKALDDTNLRKVCGAALDREAQMSQRATAWNVLNKACKLVS